MTLRKIKSCLKNIEKKSISPVLKKNGFKKRGLTWNKTIDGLVQVIDFQLSRFSNEEEESFTINLGFFDPLVWKICWKKEPPNFIKEENCFPRIRIGQLLQDFSIRATDYWWECNNETNEVDIGLEIADLLEYKCIPFLNELLNHQSVDDFISSKPMKLIPIEKIYLAIIRFYIGKTDSSISLLNEVNNISQTWYSRVSQVKSALSKNVENYPVSA